MLEVCDVVVDTEDAEVVSFWGAIGFVAFVCNGGKSCSSKVMSTSVNFFVRGGFVFFALLWVVRDVDVVRCFNMSA